jgi:hypothetical protein
MTDNAKPGAAQNKLGELFVDFGSSGLGKLIKGMNSVSATFLLTKNAAQQVMKPIADVTKKSLATVTGWDKLNATMGLSLKELQDINIFSKLNNVDFNQYIGQIKTAQQRLIDIQTGMSNDVQGFALLGLNPREYDAKNPLVLLDAIKKKVQQVDEVTGAAALRWFGFSDDLLYVWRQQNTTFNERLKLNDREMENLKETQTYWNSLSASWDAAQSKFISNQTWINDLLKKTTNWLAGMHPHLEKILQNFAKWLEEDHPGLNNLLTSMEWMLTTSGKEKWEGIKDFYLGGTERTINLLRNPIKPQGKNFNAKPGSYDKYEELWKNNPMNPENIKNGVIPDALKPSTGVTPNANTSVNYTNNITQNISGTDALQIANASADKINDATQLNAIQYRNQAPL